MHQVWPEDPWRLDLTLPKEDGEFAPCLGRRNFLAASLSALIAGGVSLAGPVWSQEEPKSRVVLVRDLELARDPDEPTVGRKVREMVHAAVLALSGCATRADAWSRYLQPKDIVGIKVNAIAPGIVPHPSIADAIAEGGALLGMKGSQFIVFDKEDRDLEKSGYTINKGGNDLQCYGTVGPLGAGNPGYEERQTIRGDTNYKLSRIVTRQCTAVVNVPVIKDHCWAGLTCALKNHFGCIDNPNQFHKVNHCCPAIVDVNRDANIRSKQRLILADARFIQYEGGPSFKPQYLQPYYAILASTDPVAVDTLAMQLIDACRSRAKLPALLARPNGPLHVAEAARQKLGTNDPTRIELVVKELGASKPK